MSEIVYTFGGERMYPESEVSALRAENARLRRWRTEADCRYTMGDVAEMSGSHCPWEKPCDRCAAEREIERLRAALEVIRTRTAGFRVGSWEHGLHCHVSEALAPPAHDREVLP
jgi:hypothetical protein